MTSCDIIVVGAGSAGCWIAGKLDQAGLDVILIEPASPEAPPIDRQRPARWLNLVGSPEDWDFKTQPDAGISGRQIHWPRGRGIGGSSRINAMIWFPPTTRDFETLCKSTKWTRPELVRSLEAVVAEVMPEAPRWLSEPSTRFLRAAADLGHQPQVYQRFNRRGRRWTAAARISQLPPEKLVRASVRNLIVDHDRIVGVSVTNPNSNTVIHCRKGVVLCGGTIASPTILMQSGIGCPQHLKEHQIYLQADLPSVGQNLQDHLIMPVISGIVDDPFASSTSMGELARWQIAGSGPLTSNIAECGGMFHNHRFQIHVTPTHYLKYPNAKPAMTLGVNVSQPKSRGQIRLRSSDIQDPPFIEPNYLSHPEDLKDLVDGVRLCRSIAAHRELSSWCGQELLPGVKRSTDESIEKSIRRYAQTLYHPTSTCRVGEDESSVVDSEFSLRHMDGCWIVDGSILPQVTTGNPSVTIMMLAEHFCQTTMQSF